MPHFRRLLVLLVLAISVGCGSSGNVSDDARSDPQTGQGAVPADGETMLTRIVALNWSHRGTSEGGDLPAIRVRGRDGERTVRGLAVAFGGDPVEDSVLEVGTRHDVQSRSLSPEVFQVYARGQGAADVQRVQIQPRAVLPLRNVEIGGNGRIARGTIGFNDDGARGALFVFPDDLTDALEEVEAFHVHVLGDAIIDRTGRAVDAEFVRGQLPTGDRPAEAETGVQGGRFESWFYPTEPTPVAERNRQVVEKIFSAKVDLNTADFEELSTLPHVGGAVAGRILAFRDARGEPLSNPFQLAEVQSLTEERIQEWEGRVTPPIPRQSARVDLNAADFEKLLSLPHVGRAVAGRILAFRENLGGTISDPLQLADVQGLTEERLREWEGRVIPPLPGQ